MINKKFEERLSYWRNFRIKLEDSENPVEDTLDFWSQVPEVSIAADPYDQSTWPTPWEMIEENNFCPFVKILAICYTLQLTDKFSQSAFEIHITQDRENYFSKYLLIIDNLCIGYNKMKPIHVSKLPKSLKPELIYPMPRLQ